MLIIPLTGKISARNPPAVTILIILINCFVFFILQAGDKKKYRKATEFYFKSGLARIEVSAYFDYLKATEKNEIPSHSPGKRMSRKTILRSWARMQKDHVFIQKLHNDEIITPEDRVYEEWKALREKHENMMSGIISMRFAFRPAEPSLVTTFTHMFLHGSFMHLLGNMIFLWLVGCVLELGCGRPLYLGIYILTGILAVWLFAFVYMDSRVPLVGASGAISGLVGAYMVLYGKRKIKIFYTIGVYFNYTRLSAIFLLPIWIGNEIFQLLFGAFTHIAYVAHIGGLIGGSILGYLNRKYLGLVNEDVFAEDPKEKIAPLLEEALQRIGKLDMHGARPLLEQVLEIDPQNRSAMNHLFNIDKLNPADERFHVTVTTYFRHLLNDQEAHGMLYDTYKEYCRVSKRLRLSLDLLFRIGSNFSAHGYLEESERIMALLLKKHPKFPKVPAGILGLAKAYLKKGMKKKGKKCLQIIHHRFPNSAESQIAKRLLKL